MPEQNTFTLSSLGPWIISAIALIQVWIIALVKKLKKPKLEIYESGSIEVGFSNFGHSLGLIGTLHVVNKDVFIQKISLSLKKNKDNSKHVFSWKAFRSNIISLRSDAPLSLEIASSFLLTRHNPYKYNIFFIDESYISDINPKIAQIPSKWFDYKIKKYKELEQHEDFTSNLNNPMVEQIIYDEFAKTNATLDEYTALDRSFYWEDCDYELEMIVQTTNPKKTYSKLFRFSLNEDQVKQLRLNTVGIIQALCGFSQNWYFAFPEYQTVKLKA